MKQYTKIFTVCECQKLKTSKLGNPKKRLLLIDNYGDLYGAKTATNSSVSYLLGDFSKDKKYIFTYHFTKSGKMIIDYGKELKNLGAL